MPLIPTNRTGRSVRWLLLLTLLAALPLGATPATTLAQSSGDTEVIRATTADRLARGAIMMLRLTKPPMPVDYQLCAEQLRLALTLDPGNPSILRSMREALYYAGDIEGFNDATRDLARLEPKDTVLQLSVISARITAIQNAEDRLDAYDRLLSDAGSAIDPSVKSRLAFDASMLAQELGDTERFVRMLTLATQLDPTNKAAAARAADYFLATNSDPKGRIELLANVVLADPLDPSAHMNLAREFLRHGATRAAQRFIRHTTALWQMMGEPQDEGTLLQRFALQWLHDGGQSVLDQLDEVEKVQRFTIMMQRKQMEEDGEDPESLPGYKPDLIMERVRLAICSAEGLDEVRDRAIQNIESGIFETIQKAQEQLKGDDPPDRKDVEKFITNLLVQSLYLRLWSGTQLDKAEGTIEQLVKLPESYAIKPEAIERYRGWLAAQKGDRETAERLLSPTVESEPFAMLGMGVAAERVDDRRSAVKWYAKVALDEPGTLIGVWAQKRLERILGQPIAPTPIARELEALAKKLPKTIDEMVRGPQSFLVFKSELVSDQLDRLGRVLVRLSVRNVGPIPVGVGERAPVRTSTLLIPRLTLGGQHVVDAVEPEVVSLDRRLRLMPREQMTCEVWVDAGQAGALLDVESNVQASIRVRSILGFEIDQYGQYALGGLSLDHETLMATRPRLPDLGDNLEDVALAVELAEPGRPLLLTLINARTMLVLAANSNATDASEVQEALCVAILERFKTMTRDEKLFALTILPPPQSIPSTQRIDDFVASDPDPMIQILSLRRITNPDNPRYAELMASENPTVRKLAMLLHHRVNIARRISEINASRGASAEN